jgi:3-hydroxybutyrate dehydrogenase
LVAGRVKDTAQARSITEEEVIRDVLLGEQPTKRFVTVEELAALTVFLYGESAASITGTALPVDGSWTTH